MSHLKIRLVSIAISNVNLVYETFNPILILSLTFKLLSFLTYGTLWLLKLFKMCLFIILLSPSFLKLVYYYFITSKRLSLRYGLRSRNSLDIYLPDNNIYPSNKPYKVVVFISGGAWTIGFKGWGALMGKTLSDRGILVVCVDYRNFPQTKIPGMLIDIRDALIWINTHIGTYNGDKENIHLVGQSAGAHLSALFVLHSAKSHVKFNRSFPSAIHPSTIDSSSFLTDLKDDKLVVDTVVSNSFFPKQFSTTASTLDINTGTSTTVSITLNCEAESDSPEFNLDTRPHSHMLNKYNEHSFVNNDCADKSPMHHSDILPISNTYSIKIPSLAHPAIPKIKTYIGISGPYEISSEYVAHLESMGLNSHLVLNLFNASKLKNQSPLCLLNDPIFKDPECLVRLPPMYLFHGSCDNTVPFKYAEKFAIALKESFSNYKSIECKVFLRQYMKMTHTDPIIENPFEGQDILTDDILDILNANHNFSNLGTNNVHVGPPTFFENIANIGRYFRAIYLFMSTGKVEMIKSNYQYGGKLKRTTFLRDYVRYFNSFLVALARIVNPF